MGACTQHGWGVQTQGPSHPSLSEAAQSLDLQGSLSAGYSGLTCHPLKQLGKLPRPQAPLSAACPGVGEGCPPRPGGPGRSAAHGISARLTAGISPPIAVGALGLSLEVGLGPAPLGYLRSSGGKVPEARTPSPLTPAPNMVRASSLPDLHWLIALKLGEELCL